MTSSSDIKNVHRDETEQVKRTLKLTFDRDDFIQMKDICIRLDLSLTEFVLEAVKSKIKDGYCEKVVPYNVRHVSE